LAACSASLVRDEITLTQQIVDGDKGHAALLPDLARQALGTSTPDAIAVTVGPGGFTGLRAALALAHGLALGFGCPIVPVSLGEVFAAGLPHLGGRELWTAIDSKRGRIFLEIAGTVRSIDPAELAIPSRRIATAGDAGRILAAWLAARDADVMLTNARAVSPRLIAVAAERRLAGSLPPRAALPIYVEPPATRAPATAPRPQPI